MLLSRFTSLGTSSLSKPVFFFSLITLTISLILTSLILAGGTNNTPVLRNFYLVSFKYNTDSAYYKGLKKVDQVIDFVDKTKDKVGGGNKPADNKDTVNLSFSDIRVSYRGLCVENNSGWTCARKSGKLPAEELKNDPLDLVAIAELYKDKIVWSLPFWITVIGIAIGYIMVIANSIPIPFITVPTWTKKVAAAALGIAALACLGGMVLTSVISGAVSTLVDKITVDAVTVHSGRMVFASGWSVFALVFLPFMGISGVVIAEWGVERTTKFVGDTAEKAVGGATGGRVKVEDLESARTKAGDAGFDFKKGVKGNIQPGIGFLKGSLRK